VDLVVALTHVGLEEDKRLADEVVGIDLIVGGHSHTSLTEPVRVDDTWIVQAGCYARQLGVVELTVAEGRIVNFDAELRDLHPDKSPKHAASARLEKTWSERITSHFGAVIGSVEGGDLSRDYGAESAMGRWASDTVRIAAGTDIGVYNPGGLRADLVEGPLTRGDLYNVFPFGNTIVHFEVSGEDLVGLLLKNAGAVIEQDHPVMQLAGMTATWRVRAGAPDLVEVKVGGRAFSPDARYTMATNSYIADQWRYNLGFEPQNVTQMELTIFEAAMARAGDGPVVPPADHRMRRTE
jgi:2',3'-cyclic-nucleotide 2'-phosphodiesterase (5'-nucleotidase family)